MTISSRSGRARGIAIHGKHKDNGIQGPKFYETDAVPFEHAGGSTNA